MVRRFLQAEKDLRRQLHLNFDPAKKDLLITFTFSEAVDQSAAAKAFRNFELRAKRLCKRKKTEYKRLSVIEKQGQWHIHAVISGLTFDEINAIWGYGRVSVSTLDKYDNYRAVVKYFIKQEKRSKTDPVIDNTKPPRLKHAKRWTGTRNLKTKPDSITRTPITRESIMKKMPTAPKGYIIAPGSVHVSSDAYGHMYRSFSYIKLPNRPTKKNDRPKASRSTLHHT